MWFNIFSGIVSRHFIKLNHHYPTILVTINWFCDNSKKLLLFLFNPGICSYVLPPGHGLPGIQSKLERSSGSSHMNLVSATMRFPLLGLYTLQVFLCNPATGIIALHDLSFLLGISFQISKIKTLWILFGPKVCYKK